MKKCYLATLTLLTCLFAGPSLAQPICGFDAIHMQKMSTSPEYRKQVFDNEARLQTIIKEQQSRRSTSSSTLRTEGTLGTLATLYTIPVVVHVIHTGGAIGTTYNPTDAQITGAISYLNQVYAGTYAGMEAAGSDAAGEIQVQFALATRGPNCTATTGIDRVDGSGISGYAANGVRTAVANPGVDEMLVKTPYRWDPSTYYNIYVVNKINGADGTSGQFTAGYAYFPSANPYIDGTVMLATQFVSGAKTLPHEIGHALNLYHPFQGSGEYTDCPLNANCNTDGDLVCDTDPIAMNFDSTTMLVDFTCRTGANTCTGAAYNIRTERNFMNYTSCYTLFTPDQKTRMLAAMSLTSRSCLANSYGINAYPITFASPVAASCAPTTSATGLGGGGAGLSNVTINSRSFNSEITYWDNIYGYTTGYINRANSCTNLIPLQVGGTYPVSFTLWANNREQLRAWIDYNNDGVFDNTTEQLFHEGDIVNTGNYMNFSRSITLPSTGITLNTVLRLRITEEVSNLYSGGIWNITDGCYAPTYGQTEDYPVYITSGVLPVGLEYFKGEKLSSAIRLYWKTNSENNAGVFDVERSNNGNDFSVIGTVAAINNTTGSLYTYDDNNYSGQVIYYRLKQVDKNGQFKYSGIVTFQNGSTRENVVTIYNNPFKENFDISIYTPEQSKVVVNMLDVTGKLLYAKTLNTSTNSTITIRPETTGLSAGMYFVQVNINGNKIIKKVIKK